MRIAVAGGTGLVGTFTVEAAREAGHEVVVMSRSTGVDTRTGAGLAAALAGVEVVIDTTNPGTTDEAEATGFFTESTKNLQREGAAQGVRRLIVLSIVGIDDAPSGYYAAKVAQEKAALAGPVPATILRATQFHEFAAQMIAWNRDGGVARIPNLHVQPVAARAVGRVLAGLVAEASLGSRVPDLAGPEQADLAALAGRVAERFDLGVTVEAAPAGMPSDALVPHGEAHIEGPTFEEWLSGADAAAIAAQA